MLEVSPSGFDKFELIQNFRQVLSPVVLDLGFPRAFITWQNNLFGVVFF